MTVDFTTEEKELAQWLEETFCKLNSKGQEDDYMLSATQLEANAAIYWKDAWLLTARRLQEILYKKDEVIADRLYDINRRISLNCIAMKKGITPSQARVINLALGDIIKDLRKSHFFDTSESGNTKREASVNTEDESKRVDDSSNVDSTLASVLKTPKGSSSPLSSSDEEAKVSPKGVVIIDNNPLSIASYLEDHPDVKFETSPEKIFEITDDGLKDILKMKDEVVAFAKGEKKRGISEAAIKVSPKGVCKCGHEMKEHRFYPGNSTSLCKGNYPDCNCTEYEGER